MLILEIYNDAFVVVDNFGTSGNKLNLSESDLTNPIDLTTVAGVEIDDIVCDDTGRLPGLTISVGDFTIADLARHKCSLSLLQIVLH